VAMEWLCDGEKGDRDIKSAAIQTLWKVGRRGGRGRGEGERGVGECAVFFCIEFCVLGVLNCCSNFASYFHLHPILSLSSSPLLSSSLLLLSPLRWVTSSRPSTRRSVRCASSPSRSSPCSHPATPRPSSSPPPSSPSSAAAASPSPPPPSSLSLATTSSPRVLHLILQYDCEDDGQPETQQSLAVSRSLISALVGINAQFSNLENRVIASLLSHPLSTTLASRILTKFNEGLTPAELKAYVKFFGDVFDSQSGLFFSSDLKVVVEICIRELVDLPSRPLDLIRRGYVDLVELLLRSGVYERLEFHRMTDLKAALEKLDG